MDWPWAEITAKAAGLTVGLLLGLVALAWIVWAVARPRRRRGRHEPRLQSVITSPHAIAIARAQLAEGRRDADVEAWDDARAWLADDGSEQARDLRRLRDSGPAPWQERS